jgi:hypothetical protein
MIRRAAIALLILVLAAVALLLVNFRLAASNTAANTTFASGKNNIGETPASMPVYLWIEEKDSLSTGLRDQLLHALRASGRFDPRLLPTPKPTAADVPLLRVWVERPGLSWTPFYAQADMLVRFGFSTYTTDISFEEDPPIRTPSSPWALYGEGNLNLKDQSYGLISLPAYWDYLSTHAADAIVKEITRVLE